MTLVRGLAVRISGVVVWWASPGCKEWAEGLEREVAFIESDWRALGWALGSMRVVLDRREEPMGSLADVPKTAQLFVERARSGGGNLWIAMGQAPLFLLRYFDAKTSLIERRRLKAPWKDDVYDDIGACTMFYRTELERQRYRLWIPSFLMMCYCVGLMLAQRGGVLGGEPLLSVTAGIGCLLAVPVFMYARRANLQRIERLDALLADAR
jgi:hypothetical protein